MESAAKSLKDTTGVGECVCGGGDLYVYSCCRCAYFWVVISGRVVLMPVAFEAGVGGAGQATQAQGVQQVQQQSVVSARAVQSSQKQQQEQQGQRIQHPPPLNQTPVFLVG